MGKENKHIVRGRTNSEYVYREGKHIIVGRTNSGFIYLENEDINNWSEDINEAADFPDKESAVSAASDAQSRHIVAAEGKRWIFRIQAVPKKEDKE